jgi:membrane-associated phospholipid phosphatase
VIYPNLSFPQSVAAIAAPNPLFGTDQEISTWFHAHLTWPFVHLLRAFSEPGSGEFIGFVLFVAVCLFIWKRAWPALVTLIVAVPGGMLLNELVKILVHRHRPFLDGPFVDWSGYSFASGHTIGATLLYGQLALFLLPMIKSKSRQRLIIAVAAGLITLVGFSRIALGAHYLTDVLAAMFFGIIWLAFCGIAGRPMRQRHLQLSLAPADSPIAGEVPVAVPVEHDRVVAANS